MKILYFIKQKINYQCFQAVSTVFSDLFSFFILFDRAIKVYFLLIIGNFGKILFFLKNGGQVHYDKIILIFYRTCCSGSWCNNMIVSHS